MFPTLPGLNTKHKHDATEAVLSLVVNPTKENERRAGRRLRRARGESTISDLLHLGDD